MQRFFVEPHQIDEEAHQIHITGTDVNHIANVLRMKQGEELWISDGSKYEYRCTIRSRIMSSQAGFICSRACRKRIRWN